MGGSLASAKPNIPVLTLMIHTGLEHCRVMSLLYTSISRLQVERASGPRF